MDLELIIILASVAVIGVIAVKVAWLVKLTNKDENESDESSSNPKESD